MSPGIRATVFIIFAILGTAFISVLGALTYEYPADWPSIATVYSQLFLFFPTFGILALCAFFFPACVFLDMYWNHITAGRMRVVVGGVALAVGSFFLAQMLLQGVPAVWQVKPEILKTDQGEPPGCAENQSCARLPVLEAMSLVRQVSQTRAGLGPFDRDCYWDKDAGEPQYLPTPDSFKEERFCFATGRMAKGAACCQAQENLRNHMQAMYAPLENRALTGKVHEWVLPFIIFFLLVLFVIGLMLVIRRGSLDEFYGKYLNRLERGVLVGAFAMLFWPLSNHAYIQSSAVMFGGSSRSLFVMLAPGFSLLFGLWALMLLFFFLRRYKQDVEMVGKIGGVIVSGIAFLRYEELVGYFERLAGSGADSLSLGFLGAILLTAFLQLIIWRSYDRELRY
ncbi:hypothetical protein [Dichotomicrobium thermohalophilum]|uniref:Uncharacterized protein n=1 Tax=Dichotomicrobium thermohalophilum TaxID=933063 RepID=A0A397Q5T0_9HYPH|nr:hypothetical protein [Dichotomicrobium thermohalophilum]RIA55165.1 hypothetical protein BXY53_0218 [Dichotomicrobium thermohalophilum]